MQQDITVQRVNSVETPALHTVAYNSAEGEQPEKPQHCIHWYTTVQWVNSVETPVLHTVTYNSVEGEWHRNPSTAYSGV